MSLGRVSLSRVLCPWKHACKSQGIQSCLPRQHFIRASHRTYVSATKSTNLYSSRNVQFSGSHTKKSMPELAAQLPESPAADPQMTTESSSDLVHLPVHGVSRKPSYGKFWLRENCQCSKCIHPDTRQRISNTFAIPEDVSPNNVSYSSGKVEIEWSDGHRGVYPDAFLRSHAYESSTVSKKQPLTLRAFKSQEPANETFPTVSYQQVMADDKGLLEWLHKIYVWGFCFVKGVPVEPEATESLLERISFIRHTHYGGFWDFTADLTFKDTAYTTDFLGAHTDNTYFTDPARLQLFHLLSHTDGHGGASLLVDGFKAAQVMMAENPENCRRLATMPQPFHSSGNADVCIQPVQMFPVLSVHPQNNTLYQIRWNNYDRAARSDWDVKQQKEWYAAARHWDEIIRRPELEIWTQLEPGTALIFDNWRMLHGRSDFVGKRRMCGGYINNDDFLSRYRLLKFGREDVLNQIGSTSDVETNPNMYL